MPAIPTCEKPMHDTAGGAVPRRSRSATRRAPGRAVWAGATGVLMLLGGLVAWSGRADAQGPPRPLGPDPKLYQEVVSRAVSFLVHHGQAADGSFSSQMGVGVTALATTALMRHGRTPSDPAVAKGLKYLERFIQPDGGVYQPGTFYMNYETCLAILCFREANADGRYTRQIKQAEAFLKKLQWDEGEGKDKTDPSYGGAGYGKQKRPDLSNTAFLIEALRACGNGPEDEAIQKALVFVSRCQNLESEFNTTPFPAKNPDGGFYYTCAAGGQSMAGTLPNGGLRSYASMTYAGLKSMIYAGVTADDPRVKAAKNWIARYYDLSSNPGMEQAGLYYYYHLFAKTLDALGEPSFADAQGVQHDWRRELVEELAKRQQPDGSWTNQNDRWMEGDPNLVTSYALLALAYCRPGQ